MVFMMTIILSTDISLIGILKCSTNLNKNLVFSLCFIFLFFKKFIYLIFYFWLRWVFIAACGLSLVSGSRRSYPVVLPEFLTAVASLIWSTAFSVHGRSSCGAGAQLLRNTWNLPSPVIKPTAPALAGWFLTTGPPGKSIFVFLFTL